MAPRGSKRTAAAAAGGLVKRKATTNFAHAQCDTIAKALAAADRGVLPKEAADMLAPMLRPCLAAPKAERHRHQAAVVEMVGRVLQELLLSTEKDVEQRRAAVGNVDADRAERSAKLDEAKRALVAFEAAVAAKKEELNAAARHCSAKSAELLAAEKALEELDRPFALAAEKREQLKAAMDALEFLRAAPAAASPEGKAHYKRLVKMCTDFDIETDLAEVVFKCLRRDVAARQAFDDVSLEHLASAIRRFTAECEEQMATLEEPRAKASEAARAAREARTAAEEARAASHGAVTEARAAERQGQQELRLAEKHLAAWLQDAKVTMDGFDDRVEKLAAFRSGSLAAFEALRELAPEPEAVPAAAAAGEACASNAV